MRVAVLLIFVSIISSCQKQSEDEALARTQCGSCHVYPDPSLLDKATWRQKALPEMKFRMGLDLTRLLEVSSEELAIITGSIPNPTITEGEWLRIEKFYLQHAPETIDAAEMASIDTISQFRIETPSSTIPPLITLLQYDSTAREIIVGTSTGNLYIMDTKFQIKDTIWLSSPPSHCIRITSDSLHILEMGKMDPNDLPIGRLIALNSESGESKILVDSLKRPVHFLEHDFDKDGDLDFLISCFGNFTGALLLFENSSGGFVKHTIHGLPGTRKAIVRDVDKDGYADICALITQGNEQITVYRNSGNLKFIPRPILQFPPVYGSSYFDFTDIDSDGDEDIIYTNGDNADYSNILKPYHGIRIFVNDGRYNFSEVVFLPMHGAFQASARDFDGDGDIDLAAIAYFADFGNSPKHGFAYFENTGNAYQANATVSLASARWILMETADFDGDKDCDILLGALNFNIGTPDSTYQRWQKNPVPFKLLLNRMNSATH